MNEWISVKDKLPPLLTEVLVFVKDELEDYKVKYYNYSSMKISFMYGRECDESLNDILRWNVFGEVTHWMPLPENPI